MIEAQIEAELLDRVFALLRPAGDADGARTLDLRDLSDDGAHRAGGGGHDYGLSGLRLADVQQSHVRGERWHAEHAECARRLFESAERKEIFSITDSEFLPAGVAEHEVAGLEAWIVGSDDATDGPARHDFPDRDGARIRGCALVHHAAHVRIER